jgi:hypothetical protein
MTGLFCDLNFQPDQITKQLTQTAYPISMMKESLSCPVDGVSVNENKVRIIAFFVLVTATVFLLTNYPPLLILLIYDFLVRAFNLGKYSVLALVADGVIRLFGIKAKPTDRAPKQFAAATGLVFVALMLLSTLFAWPVLTASLCAVLIVFAFLEAFVGFCAGCYVYSLLQKLKLITS